MTGSCDTSDGLVNAFCQLSLDDRVLQDTTVDQICFEAPEYPSKDPPEICPTPFQLPRMTSPHETAVPVHGALRRLPDDVLYHLFLSMDTSHPMRSLRTTVRLSHVCAQWRAVIVCAPLLWTYIGLLWTRNRTRHSQVIESFLHRSQRLPLTIQLIFTSDSDPEPYILEWSQALSPHAHRFRELIMKVYSPFPIRIAVQTITPLKMPRLTHFDLAMFDYQGCTISMKPRSAEQLVSLEGHHFIPIARTSYLDWTVRNFHITSLSLKYVDLTMAELFPVLIVTQSTLTHLEYYNVITADYVIGDVPRITLPKLTSLHVGYRCTLTAWNLVECLILPNLRSAFVHDFGRSPESRTPSRLQDKSCSAEDKDACKLLVALCPFTKVASLTLRGVTCFSSTFEEVMLPLQYLFQGLESLVLIQCDSQFLRVLFDVTLDSRLSELESLSKLVITSDDHQLVLFYLRLRAARGLPRLKLFSVNPRMALLRHFYREFAADFHVRGQVHHQPRKESSSLHPYPRESRPTRLADTAPTSISSA
ncbi:hypothetical protein FPV67DRAFT_237863 [Lyophyllum atratum]|nr:hypothetical protein FPV67DRAFT_237863 [Lyophyllum atratum]